VPLPNCGIEPATAFDAASAILAVKAGQVEGDLSRGKPKRFSHISPASEPLQFRLMPFKIEKLIYGGDGLARLPGDEHGPGKSVFVPFVLEGEQVEATVVENKPGFARARLDAVLNVSPARIQPGCPYFQRCGGCHYQHTSYENQLAIKSAILRETLKRTAKIELACELQIHPSPEWNYRNRTRLKVHSAPEFALGYYKFRSHELLPVKECPISSPLINRAIEALWSKGHSGEFPETVREVEVFADDTDSALLIEIYCQAGASAEAAEQACDALRQLFPEIKGVVAFEQPRAGQLAEPKRLCSAGDDSLPYQVGEFGYRVSAGAFFQVNRFLSQELVQTVTQATSGQVALDLYAGGGLFSQAMAKSFPQVIAVESSQTSHSDLRHNVPPEVKAVRATTEQFLGKAWGPRPDFIVADPPRGGLGENVVRNLVKLIAPRIAYVSCDPSTLARDLRTLVSSGYRIEGAHLIDLFPQTFHIESVFHLAR
jgi:23S rRNA (uracil1939-C5)-methyltransferase